MSTHRSCRWQRRRVPIPIYVCSRARGERDAYKAAYTHRTNINMFCVYEHRCLHTRDARNTTYIQASYSSIRLWVCVRTQHGGWNFAENEQSRKYTIGSQRQHISNEWQFVGPLFKKKKRRKNGRKYLLDRTARCLHTNHTFHCRWFRLLKKLPIRHTNERFILIETKRRCTFDILSFVNWSEKWKSIIPSIII